MGAMEKLTIDAAAVAREALHQRQPGEDLDEALLRACKKLYGDSAMLAFQALGSALGALGAQLKLDRGAALEQIAGGGSGARISTTIHTMHKTTTKSLDDLSPELRAKVGDAFATEQSRVAVDAQTTVTATVTHRCRYCDFKFPADITICPQCGRTVKTSFWLKLFGR